ncbi:MAG: transporter, partial [Cyanobacteria bacterium NC_groundwater_1444_Ag_S-0.65um_54_12]|nr:transporter [Cyanobacteria bacterium NC_groundwater_1444_Ag_S-0.65um_54_12]
MIIFAQHSLAVFFITAGAGYLLSRLNLYGINLGAAAILFVGLALGAWSKGTLLLPEIIGQLGLLLFVYTIGLQAGPAFFPILRRRGFSLVMLAAIAIGLASLTAALTVPLFGIDPRLAIGLFCGGTTNTPALAAVTEALKNSPHAALPAIGYSIAYPLGVLLPILAAEFIARIRHIDIAREAKLAERKFETMPEPAIACNLQVTSPLLIGKPLGNSSLTDLGVVISRIQRGEQIDLPTPDTVLAKGDILHLIGSARQLGEAVRLVGPAVTQQPGPETRHDRVDVRQVFLSNPQLIGRRLGELNLDQQWKAIIARIRRGDVEFVPSPDTRLERGDILRIVSRAEHVEVVARYFGNSLRAIGEMDYLSLSLGVLLGIAIGMVRLPLPGGLEVQLGLAGGPLLVALVLGWLGRTGSIVWSLPMTASQMLRQLGLVMFFSSVGLRAGAHFGSAFAKQAWELILGGALVTLAASTV